MRAQSARRSAAELSGLHDDADQSAAGRAAVNSFGKAIQAQQLDSREYFVFTGNIEHSMLLKRSLH